jgi:hypothetical protein
MIKKCKNCAKEFKTYPSKVKIGRGKYCSKDCCLKHTNKILADNGTKTRFKIGQKAHNFKGIIFKTGRNKEYKYIQVFRPNHPRADYKGYVKEHWLVMEMIIGRYISNNEVVHHKDNNGLNNDENNLELMTKLEHCRFHLKDNVHRRWYERRTKSSPQKL